MLSVIKRVWGSRLVVVDRINSLPVSDTIKGLLIGASISTGLAIASLPFAAVNLVIDSQAKAQIHKSSLQHIKHGAFFERALNRAIESTLSPTDKALVKLLIATDPSITQNAAQIVDSSRELYCENPFGGIAALGLPAAKAKIDGRDDLSEGEKALWYDLIEASFTSDCDRDSVDTAELELLDAIGEAKAEQEAEQARAKAEQAHAKAVAQGDAEMEKAASQRIFEPARPAFGILVQQAIATATPSDEPSIVVETRYTPQPQVVTDNAAFQQAKADRGLNNGNINAAPVKPVIPGAALHLYESLHPVAIDTVRSITAPPTNLRALPSMQAPVIGVFSQVGERVHFTEQAGDWLFSPEFKGFVHISQVSDR